MSDREQAISELAETVPHSIGAIEEHLKRSAKFNGVYEFAVSQRERVIQLERENAAKAERVLQLERALRGLDILLDFGDIIEPNTAQTFDDPTAINAAFAAARAALNGDSK